jgi:hypothetical protein
MHLKNKSASSKKTNLVSLPTNNKDKAIWDNPSAWLLMGCITIAVLGYPIWLQSKTSKVISIHGSDASNSGLDDPRIPQEICKARSEQLVDGDLAINFDFSDRAEPTFKQTFGTNTNLTEQCNSISTNPKNRQSQIGKHSGTDPVALMTRIQTAIAAERAKGDQRVVVISIWLQAAEPVEGKPFDLKAFTKKLETIVQDRAKVTLIGPTGELREMLESPFAGNQSLTLCTVQDSASCIRSVFEEARKST